MQMMTGDDVNHCDVIAAPPVPPTAAVQLVIHDELPADLQDVQPSIDHKTAELPSPTGEDDTLIRECHELLKHSYDNLDFLH